MKTNVLFRAFCIATTLIISVASAAQEVVKLKLYSFGYEFTANGLAAGLEKRAEGRFQIEQVIGFDALATALGKERIKGGERMLVEGVQAGELDLVILSVAPVEGFVPDTGVISIPFLFRSYAHARAVLDGPIGQDILAAFSAHDMIGLAWSENGMRQLTNNVRPIREPKDLQGLKIRTQKSEIPKKAFAMIGATPTPMPWGKEFFDAMAQGTIDGQENPIGLIWRRKFFQWQKYLSLTGHIYSAAVVIMSKAAYDKLSDADKDAFVASARDGGQAQRLSVDQREQDALAALRDAGMEVVTDIEQAKFQAELAPAYVDWGRQFGDMIERVQNHP
jgi:tripartite ATP-independent transporter DctP family solute receptor